MPPYRTACVLVGFLLVGLGVAVSDETNDRVVITGQVLAPDGKPFSGAKVYVSTYTAQDRTDPDVRATTGPDGRFRFSLPRSDFDPNDSLVAVADGYGPDWAELSGLDPSGALPPLRLVKDDLPITGRVLDLENQPVPGASVRVVRVRQMPGEDLGPWIKDMQDHGSKGLFDLGRSRLLMTYERILKAVWGVRGVPHAVQTDAEGRFRLSGLGRERVVELAFDGPGLEHRQVTVVTRAGLPKGMPPFTYPARFDHRAGPAKPIVGTVRVKGTAKPAAGVTVNCALVSASGTFFDLVPTPGIAATTDKEGRYRLPGPPKSRQYHLAAGSGPYFAAGRIVNDTAGLEPITTDFEVEPGVLVRGRLTDAATGKPVRATVRYMPRPDNPRLKDFPEFARVSVAEATVEKDGSFTVAAVPGPGWLCARAQDDRYLRAPFDGGGAAPPVLLQVLTFHAIVPIDVAEKDSKSQEYRIALDPGRTLDGRVRGPDGAPLSGVHVAGLTAAPSPALELSPGQRLGTDTFTAFALDPRRPRTLVFWHEEKKLAKAVLVRGDEPGPLTVRLEPLGAVTGVLREAGAKVELRYSGRQSRTLPGELAPPAFPGLYRVSLPLPQATAGPDGRFRLDGLVPGMEYDLVVVKGKESIPLRKGLSVAGGECKDLGELRSPEGHHE